jgi:porin
MEVSPDREPWRSGRARRTQVRLVRALLVAVGLLLAAGAASAQPVDVPPTWGGDFWDRPRLTGSWWGLRDELGKKGVVLDVDALLTPQGVLSGGKDTGWKFWGNADYTLNVDTGKLGLWPGGFLKVYGDTSFGDREPQSSGAISPVNVMGLVPKLNEPTSALLHATFTQFLSPKFGLFAGKIFNLDLFKGEFAGDIRNQFMSLGPTIPSTLVLVPFSAYGGGIIVVPWENVVLSAVALDASGTTTNNDISEAFDDGAMVSAAAKVTIKPFGLVGHHTVGGTWSDKTHLSLNQDPTNLAKMLLFERFPLLSDPGPVLERILQQFFPALLTPVQPLNREDTTWSVYYTFDQYFWHPGGDQKRGIGMFFNFGASDGNPNPIKYSYAAGIGGNGPISGRPHDNFGVAWSRTQFSDNFVPFLRQRLHLGLDHEDAVEIFYNAAITQWLRMSLDLQIVNPALKKTLDSSGTALKNIDTAVVGGVRMYVRF